MDSSIYKEILKDSPIVYCFTKGIKNCEGKYIDLKIIDTNKSFEIFTGYNLESIKNKNISEFMTSEEFQKLDLNKSLSKAVLNKKYTVKRFNKSLHKHFNVDIYDGKNDMFAIRVTLLDKEKLKISNLLETFPFAAWIKDRDGLYIDVNTRFLEKFGLEYDDTVGKNDSNILNQELYTYYANQDNDVMTSRSIKSYQEVIKAKNETNSKVYQVSKWPYIGENNDVLGTIGIAIELVDDASLRENIKKNEENFSEISNHIDDVFIIIDKEKPLYISPSFGKVFGRNPDKLYKDIAYKDIESWKEYYHPDDLKNIDVKFEEAGEYIVRAKPNGNEDKWLLVKMLPIRDERGYTIKKIIIISDITKRKKLDTELENLRVDFFANLTHELRTPINLVLSSTQLLNLMLNNSKEINIEAMNRYTKMISQNGLRLLKLVNNFLDSTKIDAGYFEYNPQNFEIISFVENICMSVCDFAEQYDITLRFDTEIEEKIVAFDLDMMERIILNLLSNAIKFSKENGKIEVYISYDDYIKISIKDNGIGIEQDKLNSIFSRYEQASNKKSHENQGTGIGLSLVKSLVEMHNGNISVKSEINKGTEFVVSIPNITLHLNESSSMKNLNDTNINRLKVEFSDIY